MSAIVEIIASAGGHVTEWDGQYVVEWSPHTPFGTAAVKTTPDRSKARRFADAAEIMQDWCTVSDVEPTRPTDGKPNRPLSGLCITIHKAEE